MRAAPAEGGAGRDRADAIKLAGLPEPAVEKFDIYAALLRKWQGTINLVAPSTLENMWTRHFADGWQLVDAAPAARRWVDMGAGAGFPGLVIAIRLAAIDGAHVDLIESDQRKAAFLRHVSRETGVPATVHCGRIEAMGSRLPQPDAVTARALAPLPQLLAYAGMWLDRGAVGVFPKGQDVEAELTDSSISGKFLLKIRPSLTEAAARILVLQKLPEA